jgi:hypothetical protein
VGVESMMIAFWNSCSAVGVLFGWVFMLNQDSIVPCKI